MERHALFTRNYPVLYRAQVIPGEQKASDVSLVLTKSPHEGCHLRTGEGCWESKSWENSGQGWVCQDRARAKDGSHPSQQPPARGLA